MKSKKCEVIRTAVSKLPTTYGVFQISVYRSKDDYHEHVCLRMGKKLKEPVLVRVHSQCITGEVFHSLKCDCREQLQKAMRMIGKKGEGLIIYLNQEGRGIGLTNKIKAYALQDQGLDTVEANHALGFMSDERNFNIVAQILCDQGVKKITLLTNNPEKMRQLKKLGVEIADRIPVEIKPNRVNKKYLLVKKKKMGHKLKLV